MELAGGQIVVETLIREGVPYIVGIPGHGTLSLSDALIINQDRRDEPRARPSACSLSGSPAVGWWDVPVPTYLPERRAQYEQERAEEQ